jgi:hypothetical protein
MQLTDQTGVVPKSVERISAANPFAEPSLSIGALRT